MCQWIWSVLVKIMACRLFGTKLLSKPMLHYCQLDPWEQTSVNFWSMYHIYSINLFIYLSIYWFIYYLLFIYLLFICICYFIHLLIHYCFILILISFNRISLIGWSSIFIMTASRNVSAFKKYAFVYFRWGGRESTNPATLDKMRS